MMNDEFVHEQASHLASRLPPVPESERVVAAFQMAFGRPPTREEVAEARQYLGAMRQKLRSLPLNEQDQLAWRSLARAILASNEFLFVD
jgi:hypothetical protein